MMFSTEHFCRRPSQSRYLPSQKHEVCSMWTCEHNCAQVRSSHSPTFSNEQTSAQRRPSHVPRESALRQALAGLARLSFVENHARLCHD